MLFVAKGVALFNEIFICIHHVDLGAGPLRIDKGYQGAVAFTIIVVGSSYHTYYERKYFSLSNGI